MAPKTPLWTPGELEAATKGRWISKPDPDAWDPIKVSYDTRNGRLPGHICVMVTPISWGRSRQESVGRVAKLAQNQAAAAIIQREQKQRLGRLPPGFPVLVVKDTRNALRDLARASRKRFRGKVVAVTGTVGKTTTREMLKHVLGQQGGAEATTWNNNNVAGVQRTLAYSHRDLGWIAVEMGFGLPLDGIRTSSLTAKPHAAILTTVSKAHIDAFPPQMLGKVSDEELVCRHKTQIFEGLTQDGVALIGMDNPALETAMQVAKKYAARVITFGAHQDADARLTDVEVGGDGSRATVAFDGREFSFQIKPPGRHMVVNALGVLMAAYATGADFERAIEDIGSFEPVVGRASVAEFSIRDGKGRLIDDSFNATIASVKSSMELLGLFDTGAEGRRIAVLGDVGHIGPDEIAEHAALAKAAENSPVDLVFTNGKLMRHMWDALPDRLRGTHTDTMPALFADLRERLRPGDVIALKSGRGTGGMGDREFLKLGKALRSGAQSWPAD